MNLNTSISIQNVTCICFRFINQIYYNKLRKTYIFILPNIVMPLNVHLVKSRLFIRHVVLARIGHFKHNTSFHLKPKSILTILFNNMITKIILFYISTCFHFCQYSFYINNSLCSFKYDYWKLIIYYDFFYFQII